MNKHFIRILILTGIVHAWPAPAGAESALDIMKKNEEVRKVNEFESRARLTTGNSAEKTEKVKEFTFWRKVQTDRIHNSTLTRFHAPAEVRNEGILILENPDGKNDVLLYLPNFKKTRRVESQQQSGSFMGSVFSYSDIATPHTSDYRYKTLRQEKCPGAEHAPVTCHVIEALPANEDVQERTGYSKSVVWVRADNFMAVKGEYTNVQGELFKRLEAGQIKMVDPKEKKWLAHFLSIENLKTRDYTRLVFSSVKVNGGIPDATFTQQNLQKVR
jgi:outer membrane lipoprotein-sorting protein